MRKREKHTWHAKDNPKKAREAIKAVNAKRAKKAAQERRGAGKKNPRNLKKMKKKKKNLLHHGKLSKRLKPNNSRHRKRRSEKERRRFTEKPNSTTNAIKEGKSLRDKVNNLKMRPMLFMTKL